MGNQAVHPTSHQQPDMWFDESTCQLRSQSKYLCHQRHSSAVLTSPNGPFRDGRATGLQLLVGVLLLDALVARGGALLVKLRAQGTMKLLFEDRLWLNRLELSLEVLGSVGAGVGSTAWVIHVRGEVFELVTLATPIQSPDGKQK